MGPKVVASGVSIRKCDTDKDGHSFISSVKKILPLFSSSNNPTTTSFASKQAKRFQK